LMWSCTTTMWRCQAASLERSATSMARAPAAGVGLEQGHEVRGRGRVGRQGDVLGDAELVELD
jgi:hypothetical protein